MIRRRPELDMDNPPGQLVFRPENPPPGPDTLQRNIEEWKRYEESRNEQQGCYPGCYYYTDSCFREDCKKK